MTNEEKILVILEQLQEGQKKTDERLDRIEVDIKGLKKDTKEIKRNLNYVWDDIKRIDDRLQVQEEKVERLVK